VLVPKKDVDIIVPKRNLEKTVWEKITSIFDFSDDETPVVHTAE